MDAGLQVVNDVFRLMMIDEQWSVRENRGFTWWGKDLAQRVWADAPFLADGLEIARVHARTDLIEGFDGSGENVARLGRLGAEASLSSLIIDPDDESKVQYAASMDVHEEIREWATRLFLAAAGLQAAESPIIARRLSELLGGRPAASAHPVSGPREETDEILSVIENVFAPEGEKDSAWRGVEMVRAGRFLRDCGAFGNADEGGLTAEFPFGKGEAPSAIEGGKTALLRVITEDSHPRLGKGVLITLSLPISVPDEDLPRTAVGLNGFEHVSASHLYSLGSWCPDAGIPGTLTHVTFVPNAAHQIGLLNNVVLAAGARSNWVAENLNPLGLVPRAEAETAKSRPFLEEIVYGEIGGLVFMPRGVAERNAAIYRAMGTAGTWGQLKEMVDADVYEEMLEIADLEEPPDPDDPQTLAETNAVGDGDWPIWPAQYMLDWVPEEIQEEYGAGGYSAVSGPFLEFDPDDEERIVTAFEAAGYRCTRDDALVSEASGY